MSALFLALVACVAPITVLSRPPGAEVYITDHPPVVTMKPATWETMGVTPFVGVVDYFVWDTYYVWVDAPGYQAQVREVNNEVKVGPALGGFFCLWPIWVWAWGPDDAPIYVDLIPGQGPEDGAR